MKPSGNKILHRSDHEMVCDRNFFGCVTPGGSPQSSSNDVTAKMTSYDFIIQTLGASAGGKAAEKLLSHTISSEADPGGDVGNASPPPDQDFWWGRCGECISPPAIFNNALDE